MNSEIISVGTEILLGDVINTNASYISEKLTQLGINCYYHTVVGDNKHRLKKVIETALKRSDIIFFTGGLGPTYDDLTKEIVAESIQEPLVLDEVSYERLLDYFKSNNREMSENNKKQAYIFENGHALANDKGTAPGLLIEKKGKTLILLPGPPFELVDMFEKQVMPYFDSKIHDILVSKRIYLWGIGESNLETILKEEMETYTNPTLAPYSDRDGLYIRVTASAETEAACIALIDPVIDYIHEIVGEYVYSVDIPRIEDALRHKYASPIYVLENKTQGLLSHRLGSLVARGIVLNQDLSLSSLEETLTSLKDVHRDGMVVGFFKTEIKGEYKIVIYMNDLVFIEKVNYERGHSDDDLRVLNRATSHALKMMLDIVSV